MAVDKPKLDAFMSKMVGEMGAAINASLILLGDRLGLYRAMACAGPMTPADLAKKTGTHERYVREWLNAQATAEWSPLSPATMVRELIPSPTSRPWHSPRKAAPPFFAAPTRFSRDGLNGILPSLTSGAD